MSEPESSFCKRSSRCEHSKYFNAIFWIVVFAAVVYLIIRNISAIGNVVLVLLGFGAVVLVHEFGHFVFAKLSGIKVEAFSIGFPPALLGILRTEKGYRIRILPKFFPGDKDKSEEGRLSFTIGRKAKAGETEYRVGLIPAGGFVKMLGQEDVGSVKGSDDPRSFANKSVGSRMAVITAGVVFNAISALIVFMVVFLIGINLPPAVVGGVVPNSPAARAGLRAGDEIIEVAGENDNLDFSNIAIAAALSDVNEAVSMKAKRADGSIEDFSIVAEQFPGMPTKVFGIDRPMSLTIAEVSDANELLSRTGLLSGDRIRAVNGKDVQSHWELERIVEDALLPEIRVLAERGGELVEARIHLSLSPVSGFNLESESDLSHIYSMVPRMRITVVLGRPATAKDKLQNALNKIGIGKVESEPGLQEDDIILSVGDIGNPTFKELREVASEYEDKELVVKVLRMDSEGVESSHSITVVPRRPPGSEQVMIGIGVALDAEHPVVAKTISVEGGPERLAIPRGALITAVDGRSVSDFYEVIKEIKGCSGERITIDWRVNEEMAGDVSLEADTREDLITVKSSFADFVPFEDLRRLYKARGPAEAIVMGYKKTIMFVAQAYMTVKRLIGGLVSPKSLIGPVGIITYSYRIVAEQPLIYYVYFLGLISAVIAVFNFLPLPPLDGGLIVILLVEKIKGSALSERTQGIAAYAGWVLIGSFFLYVTFNDIVRSFFR